MSDSVFVKVEKEVIKTYILENIDILDVNRNLGDGLTVLHHASSSGDLTLVELLLQKSPNINLQDAREKRTALHFAVESNSAEVVDSLLRSGADVNIRDCANVSPLHMAVENSYDDILEKILQSDCRAVNHAIKFCTPLSVACMNDSLKTVEILTTFGASCEHDYPDSLPALKYSVNAEPRIFEFILQHTDLNSMNWNWLDDCFGNISFPFFVLVHGETDALELFLRHHLESDLLFLKQVQVSDVVHQLYLHFLTLRNGYKLKFLFKHYLNLIPSEVFMALNIKEKLFLSIEQLNLCYYLFNFGIPRTSVGIDCKKSFMFTLIPQIASGGDVFKQKMLVLQELLHEPVLSLKKLCVFSIRKNLSDRYRDPWDAFCLIRNSSWPRLIKEQIWLEDSNF